MCTMATSTWLTEALDVDTMDMEGLLYFVSSLDTKVCTWQTTAIQKVKRSGRHCARDAKGTCQHHS